MIEIHSLTWSSTPYGLEVELVIDNPPNEVIDLIQWHVVNKIPLYRELFSGGIPGPMDALTVTDFNIQNEVGHNFGRPFETRRTVTLLGTG